MNNRYPYKRRPTLHWAALFLFLLGGAALGVWQLMHDPDSPLPDAWNPVIPLKVDDKVTAITKWKLGRALASDQACLAALGTGARAQTRADFVENAQCRIVPQVTLTRAAGAALLPVNTRCQTALRLAMWAQHGLQPAADEIFGQRIARIEHFSSYACRAIRSTNGGTGRMSTHATADAIDISGFMLADGTRISLLNDWDETGAKGDYLRRANDTACDWFRVTLGPAYNTLHADHFHLQHTGYGACR